MNDKLFISLVVDSSDIFIFFFFRMKTPKMTRLPKWWHLTTMCSFEDEFTCMYKCPWFLHFQKISDQAGNFRTIHGFFLNSSKLLFSEFKWSVLETQLFYSFWIKSTVFASFMKKLTSKLDTSSTAKSYNIEELYIWKRTSTNLSPFQIS